MSFVDWNMASYLYCFPYSYRSFNYCDSNRCRSFTLLKALAKSNSNLFAIAFKSEKEWQLSLSIVGRVITLEREPSKKKQRTDTKKGAKRIKSKNFTRSNREKSNIAIAILYCIMILGSCLRTRLSLESHQFSSLLETCIRAVWIRYTLTSSGNLSMFYHVDISVIRHKLYYAILFYVSLHYLIFVIYLIKFFRKLASTVTNMFFQ